jgi:hypothetical protein
VKSTFLLTLVCLAFGLASGQSAFNKVLDLNTAAPWGGIYTGTTSIKNSGGHVYFLGTSGSGQGFVRRSGGVSTSLADLTKNIPGKAVKWLAFTSGDAHGSGFAFGGSGSGVNGIYYYNGTAVSTVVDNFRTVPGTSALFTNFSEPILRSGKIAFVGTTAEGSPRTGFFVANGNVLSKLIAPGTIYPGRSGTVNVTQIGYGGGVGGVAVGSENGGTARSLFYANGNLTKLVEVGLTAVPDIGVPFTGVLNPFMVGSKVYFRGSYDGGRGIYSVNTNGTGLATVVNGNTTVSGSPVSFILMFIRGVTAGNVLYFEGTDNNLSSGLYRWQNGTLTRVLQAGDVVGGKTVNTFTGNVDPASDTFAARIMFTDGSAGIYTSVVSTPTPSFTLTRNVAPSSGGLITVNPGSETGSYLSNTVVRLTATANSGYRFVRWTGASSSTSSIVNVVMNTNKVIQATFTNLPKYKLTTSVSPANAGTVALFPFAVSNMYYAGTMVNLTATPNGTNVFATWLGGTTGVTNRASLTMNANKSVSALFNNRGSLVFQNLTGQLAVWFMQNTQRVASVMLNNGVSAGTNWRLAGAADFDRNGFSDLLFRGTNGQTMVWRMSANNRTNNFTLRGGAIWPVSWRIAAAADFNNDSKPDILWQNTNNVLNAWLMNGLVYSTNVPIPYATGGYRALAAGNFDTNSSSDIVLQNGLGQVQVWLMNGLTRTGTVPLNGGVSPGSTWIVTGTTDIDANGALDIVFRRSDGAIMVWFMNGTTVLRSVILPSQIAPPWALAAVK